MSKFSRNLIISLVILVNTCLVNCDRCEDKPNFTRLPKENDPDCNKFVECLNRNEQPAVPCPEPFLFNEKTMACDWKVNVQCGVSSASSACKGKANDDVVAVPEDCNSYYKCTGDGQGSKEPCPAEQFFNPFGDATTPCLSEETWWCPSHTSRPSCSILSNSTYVYDPEDCSAYYLCVNNALLWGSCGKNMHFNFAKKMCVYGENEVCSSSNGNGEEGPSSDNICQGKAGQFIPDPKICKAYIYCVSDTLPYQGFCQNGGEFYTDGKCKSTPADSCTCEKAKTGALIKNVKNPAEYWECTANGPVRVKCPDGFIFGDKGCVRK